MKHKKSIRETVFSQFQEMTPTQRLKVYLKGLKWRWSLKIDTLREVFNG